MRGRSMHEGPNPISNITTNTNSNANNNNPHFAKSYNIFNSNTTTNKTSAAANNQVFGILG